MACEYNFYKNDGEYYPHLYCKITNNYCMYSRRCDLVNKFIPLDNNKERECYIYHMEKKKNIPNGSKYIKFERKGYLYINIDDEHTIKIKNTLGKISQDYIYIKDGLDGYEISLTPFKETIKKTYSRKKN